MMFSDLKPIHSHQKHKTKSQIIGWNQTPELDTVDEKFAINEHQDTETTRNSWHFFLKVSLHRVPQLSTIPKWDGNKMIMMPILHWHVRALWTRRLLSSYGCVEPRSEVYDINQKSRYASGKQKLDSTRVQRKHERIPEWGMKVGVEERWCWALICQTVYDPDATRLVMQSCSMVPNTFLLTIASCQSVLIRLWLSFLSWISPVTNIKNQSSCRCPL